MSDCKVKINVDICGESALDAVTNLVVNKSMALKTACKQVAKDFNDKNDGATVKWTTLRQSYYRANKGLHVTPSVTPTINIPTVDEVVLVDNNTITISKVEYDILIAENEGLTLAVEELDKEVRRLQNIINPPKIEQPDKGTIDRETAYKFIKDYGNQMQIYAITKDNPNNNRLFNIFKVVRQNYLKNNPPHTLSQLTSEATRIV